MTATRTQTRQQIGLAALMAAFSVAVLWLGWAAVVTGMLDRMHAARTAVEAARFAEDMARADDLAASRRGPSWTRVGHGVGKVPDFNSARPK